jgi:uncharacterized RDD family membrane protein YckC
MQNDLSGLPNPVLDAQFYAGVPFKRLIAWIIDAVIVGALWVVLVIGTLGTFAFFMFFGLLIVSFGYRAFMVDRYSATLGMMAVGIELRNGRGDRLDRTQAIWHVTLFLGLMVFFFINVISMIVMLVNERGQGLHDMVLGTTAINRPADL